MGVDEKQEKELEISVGEGFHLEVGKILFKIYESIKRNGRFWEIK